MQIYHMKMRISRALSAISWHARWICWKIGGPAISSSLSSSALRNPLEPIEHCIPVDAMDPSDVVVAWTFRSGHRHVAREKNKLIWITIADDTARSYTAIISRDYGKHDCCRSAMRLINDPRDREKGRMVTASYNITPWIFDVRLHLKLFIR